MRALFLVSALSLIAAPASAANQCRDAHGKFIKCAAKPAPTAAATATAKPKTCRDAKGHFAKCK